MKTIFLLLLLIPFTVLGQTLPSYDQFEPGDLITYSLNVGGKTKRLDYIFAKVEKNLLSGKVTFDTKEGEFSSSGLGFELQDFVFGSGEMTVRKPEVKIFDPTMKVGTQWTNLFEATGESFKVQVILKAQVEKFEKIKLKFTEVDCFVINFNEIIQGINLKSEPFTGKASYKIWVGVVNQRLLIVKREYQNSFDQKYIQELSESPKISDIQKRLEKLKDLLNGGLINDSDYEIKKKEILKIL